MKEGSERKEKMKNQNSKGTKNHDEQVNDRRPDESTTSREGKGKFTFVGAVNKDTPKEIRRAIIEKAVLIHEIHFFEGKHDLSESKKRLKEIDEMIADFEESTGIPVNRMF